MRLQSLRMVFFPILLATVPGAVAGPDRGAAGEEAQTLLGLLVRKGVLTAGEAEDLRAEWSASVRQVAVPVPPPAYSRVSLGLRLQFQAVHFTTDGTMTPRTETGQGFLRRAYMTLSGSVASGWSTVLTYDLASAYVDEAVVHWSPGRNWGLDFGLRKVEPAFEEHASSGDLKAIERSGVTRFFVDEDNGRRLGAAGYRLGVFAGGKWAQPNSSAVIWSVAVTNRERIDSWEEAAGGGEWASRGAALWGTVGWRRPVDSLASWQAGLGVGWMPGVSDAAGLGARPELTLGSLHLEWRGRGWNVLAEALAAQVAAERGVRARTRPRGGFLQSGFSVGGKS